MPRSRSAAAGGHRPPWHEDQGQRCSRCQPNGRSLAEEVAAAVAEAEAEAVDVAEDVLSGKRRGDVLPAALADVGSRKARLARRSWPPRRPRPRPGSSRRSTPAPPTVKPFSGRKSLRRQWHARWLPPARRWLSSGSIPNSSPPARPCRSYAPPPSVEHRLPASHSRNPPAFVAFLHHQQSVL